MKVLILSCNTGQGHNTAGRSILLELTRRGVDAEMKDALSFDSELASKFISGVHNKSTVHIPKIYGLGVSVARVLDRLSRRRSVCYLANSTYAQSLYRYIEENGFDTVVIPHVFPAEAITRIRRKRKTDFKAYFIATDYAYPPFLSDTELDAYFIPHRDLALDFAASGVPMEKLVVTGIPVADVFAQKSDRIAARRALSLPEEGNLLLVMTGSMGFGDTEPLVKELLARMPENTYVAVMGGNNQKMKNRLRARYGSDPRLFVVDFTPKVSLYMDAADVLFTKPGGLSSTEAATKGIPMIHTRPIPGWEEENIEFFRTHGLSLSGPAPEDLVTHALWLLANPHARADMVQAQNQTVNKHAAFDICNYLVSHHIDSSDTTGIKN